MFLIQKYTQYKAAQAEQQKRKVTEKELAQLNHKIDKLLTKLDEHEPEIAVNQDEECVVCVNAKATMQTYPCGHRVVCRKCFVKTIQMAVAQRLLPLRCVICRAKILRLKHSTGSVQPLPASASQYTIGHHWYNVPQSASLYSVTSNASAASGASSASSCSSTSSYKTCSSSFSSASFRKSHSGYSKLGYKPLRTTSSSPSRSPQPRSTLAMAMAKKDNRVAPAEATVPLKGKLSLIQEFRREFSHGKEKTLPTKSQMKESKLKLHGDGHCQTKEGGGSSNGNGGSSRVKGTSKQNSLDNQSFCGSSGSGSSSAGTLAGAGAAGGSSTGSNGPASSINGSSRGKGTSSSSSAGASRSNSSGSLTPLSPDGPPSRSASIGSTTQKRLSLESTPKMSAVASPGKVPSTSFLSGGTTTTTSTSSTGNIAGSGSGPGLSSASISSSSSGCLNPTSNRKTTPNKPTTPTSNLNSNSTTTNINSVKTMNQNINKVTTSTPPPKLQPPPQPIITTTTTTAAGSTGNFNSALKSSSSVNPTLSSRLSLTTRSGNKEGNSNKSLPTTTKITTPSSENASAAPTSSSSYSHLPSSGLAVNQ